MLINRRDVFLQVRVAVHKHFFLRKVSEDVGAQIFTLNSESFVYRDVVIIGLQANEFDVFVVIVKAWVVKVVK
ncbi:hypothetical protein D9M71_185620 [compost metagenome]